MTRRGAGTEDPFADVHLISGFIEKRIAQLRSYGPVGENVRLGKREREAILAFVRARQQRSQYTKASTPAGHDVLR